MGTLPDKLHTVVGATNPEAASRPAVVLEWNLADISKDVVAAKLEAEREMAQREAERAAAKARLSALQSRTLELEIRLGLRVHREPRELWMWAYRRARMFSSFGISPTASNASAASTGSLDEQLVFVQQQARP